MRKGRTGSHPETLHDQDWLSAYDFVTERGARLLNEYARAAQPFANVGDRTVSVLVTSVVRASDSSFQVKWTESEFERGSLVGTTRWTAILSIKVKTPASADALRKNPLGLYVDAIDWSKELEPAPSGSSVQSASPPAAAPPPSIPLGSPLDGNLASEPAPPVERTSR